MVQSVANRKLKSLLNGLSEAEVRTLSRVTDLPNLESLSLKELHKTFLCKATSIKIRKILFGLICSVNDGRSLNIILDEFVEWNPAFYPDSIRALGSRANIKVLKKLEQIINTSGIEEQRISAVYLLGKYVKNQLAIDTLIKVLSDSNNSDMIRARATECIGIVGYSENCQELMKHLYNPSARIVGWCIRSIGLLGDNPLLIEELKVFLNDDRVFDDIFVVSEACKEAISSIRGAIMRLLANSRTP